MGISRESIPQERGGKGMEGESRSLVAAGDGTLRGTQSVRWPKLTGKHPTGPLRARATPDHAHTCVSTVKAYFKTLCATRGIYSVVT